MVGFLIWSPDVVYETGITFLGALISLGHFVLAGRGS